MGHFSKLLDVDELRDCNTSYCCTRQQFGAYTLVAQDTVSFAVILLSNQGSGGYRYVDNIQSQAIAICNKFPAYNDFKQIQ
ncbi:hypothetical protein [Nostoc sp. 'Peltigera malacea cyanobiont' DB3992]|uniref:hypothetical protein n=1 Tax=Nostoc sp. 'Peltigera malacea cyanobiont' DB3992 TaxID=1206980 RepID=UPI000C03D945|nr:hypothetical protein [Nostoc sp. 'Peltigera malacea cyanobiont' DB3992]PHM09743.1 hypothetical protein CK516_12765 [Nostoc sp. 'Peltigera malacea cyanobiont' DB3992]